MLRYTKTPAKIRAPEKMSSKKGTFTFSNLLVPCPTPLVSEFIFHVK